ALAAAADDGERGHLDLVRAAVGGLDAHRRVRRARFADRDRQRQLLERERIAVEVLWREAPAPILGCHGAGLLEADPEQLAGGLIEEQQVARLVDEEGRRFEVRDQSAREHELDGMLLGCDAGAGGQGSSSASVRADGRTAMLSRVLLAGALLRSAALPTRAL